MNSTDASLELFDRMQYFKFKEVEQKYHELLNKNGGTPEGLRDHFFELCLSKAVRENDCAALPKHLLRVRAIRDVDFKQAVLRGHFDAFCILMDHAQRYGSDGVLMGLHAACAVGKQPFVDYALPLYLENHKPGRLADCVLAAGNGKYFDIVNQLIPYAFSNNTESYCLVSALINENYELARLVYPYSDVDKAVSRLLKLGDERNAPQGLQWIDSQKVGLKLKRSVEDLPPQTQERTRKI